MCQSTIRNKKDTFPYVSDTQPFVTLCCDHDLAFVHYVLTKLSFDMLDVSKQSCVFDDRPDADIREIDLLCLMIVSRLFCLHI